MNTGLAIDPALEEWLENNLESKGEPIGSGYQANVWRVVLPDGDPIAVKRPRHSGLRGAVARIAIRREYAAYQRLTNVTGTPRLRGLTRKHWLLIDYVEGRSLRDSQHQLVHRERLFESLLLTIQAMHKAGVAHGDLKRKDNIVVDTAEQPHLIDFGIARVRGHSRLDDLLFKHIQQLDLNSWVKLKYGGRPAAVAPEDQNIYRPLLVETLARWVRIPWQKLTLRRPRQRLKRWLGRRDS